MPYNVNPWVTELLSWHGHDRGGVRVPFHPTMGRPLGSVIETSLIRRIKQLARDLVDDTPETPRWVFLIGGPGNGKSEAVETFVHELDKLTHSNGALVRIAGHHFEPDPVAARCVSILGDELPSPTLRTRLRRLIIVQDASAVDGPDQMAEEALIADLEDLVTCPPEDEPVFICCANRGLVARACSTIQAAQSHAWLSDVADILTQLLTATGLGPEALATDRPRCWPLQQDTRFAAWPLDLDSIITADRGTSPFEQMVVAATHESKWEDNDRCGDCTVNDFCPFYANARSLRDDNPRRELLKLLRHSELAMGQRWNFRDLYSLCTELIIGQKDDFGSTNASDTPCSWVHGRTNEILFSGRKSDKLVAVWELALHLYSQALFPVWFDPTDEPHFNAVPRSTLTHAVVDIFDQHRRSQSSQIRVWLADAFTHRLDPARITPPNPDSVLREIEDEFGQSIRQGAAAFEGKLNPLIEQLLELMTSTEDEWIESVRESNRAKQILSSLRIICSMLIKRLVGVREGEYLNAEDLCEYEAIFGSNARLWRIVQPLRTVLAPDNMFGGSLIRVFGQPPPDALNDIRVTSRLGTITPRIASTSSDVSPGHDVPWIEIQKHHIPLTFDLFAAVRAHSTGVQIASFAPATRAAIDKVKNAIAGASARDEAGMLGGDVSISVGRLGILTPMIDGSVEFRRSRTNP